MGSRRTAHHLTGPGPRRLQRSLGVVTRRTHRHQTSPAPRGTLHSHHHPHQHPHHLDDPPSPLPTTRPPPDRTTSLRKPLHTPRNPLSYNFLYWIKAARSAPRTRHGPRPGLRSCLRPAPSRPAHMPRTQHAATRCQRRRTSWQGRSASRLYGATSGRASKPLYRSLRCCSKLRKRHLTLLA
jgi:hypothetical protein